MALSKRRFDDTVLRYVEAKMEARVRVISAPRRRVVVQMKGSEPTPYSSARLHLVAASLLSWVISAYEGWVVTMPGRNTLDIEFDEHDDPDDVAEQVVSTLDDLNVTVVRS